MAEVLEQTQLTNGNIFFRISYTLDEVRSIADSLALFFLDQFESGAVGAIELPKWTDVDTQQTVSNKMIFQESLTSAGMKIVARDGSHYVVLDSE